MGFQVLLSSCNALWTFLPSPVGWPGPDGFLPSPWDVVPSPVGVSACLVGFWISLPLDRRIGLPAPVSASCEGRGCLHVTCVCFGLVHIWDILGVAQLLGLVLPGLLPCHHWLGCLSLSTFTPCPWYTQGLFYCFVLQCLGGASRGVLVPLVPGVVLRFGSALPVHDASSRCLG